MRNHESILSFMAFMTVFLMVFTAIPGNASVPLNLEVIDTYFLQEMELHGMDDELEIIVQFRDELRDEDIAQLKHLGFDILLEYSVIPGVYARGTVKAIHELSNYRRSWWIELNEPMILALEETTSVVKATVPWTSEVKDGSHIDFDFNTQSMLSGLDGSGVTVAVVDTGVDGQHPDFDYGEKLIYNKHKNGADDPWIEKQNSDTSYGHGTHCAGIIAGNGDASAGRHRGVAPGAKLIGLGGDWVPFPDESPVHWAVLEGLEWVYENSRPGNNPDNIRVVSNSWGGAGSYDPNDSITVISNMLTYHNKVVVVFAAMNSGEGNHEGEEDTTSRQSKIPSVISVAAATHDGEGMANFSSRGKKGDHNSYPDITAPGVDIWATRPRGTWLGEYQLIDEDMYYMAISGTSMATPHVAGLAAILVQAAPSLGVSDHHDSYNGPDQSWNTRDDTRMHEVEYILKMTSDLIPHSEGNGVPQDKDRGESGRKMDFAQGHGMINSERAVALALTLEEMREEESDATVDDALKEYKKTRGKTEVMEKTDTLTTSWRGEWGQLTNGSNPLSSSSFATDHFHSVFVPQASTHLTIDLTYKSYDLNLGTGGRIDVTLDWDGDGLTDISPQLLDFDGNKRYEVDLTQGSAADNRGKAWSFNVEGEGIKLISADPDDEFHEALIEYTIAVQLIIEPDARISLDERDFAPYMSPWCFGEPSPDYADGRVTLVRFEYDVTDVEYQRPFLEEYGTTIAASLILLFIGLVIGYSHVSRVEKDKGLSADDHALASDGFGEGDTLDEFHAGEEWDEGSDELKKVEETGGPDDPDEFAGSVEWEDPEA